MNSNIHPTGLTMGIPIEDAVIATEARLEELLIHTRITARVAWGDRFQNSLAKMEGLLRAANRCSERENPRRIRLMKVFLDEIDNARGYLAGLSAMGAFAPNPSINKNNPNYEAVKKQCKEKGYKRIVWFVVALDDIEAQMERWRNSTMKKAKESNAKGEGVELQASVSEDNVGASENIPSH